MPECRAAKSNTLGIAHTHVAIAHSGTATHGEVSRASTRPERPPGAIASSALRDRPSGSAAHRWLVPVAGRARRLRTSLMRGECYLVRAGCRELGVGVACNGCRTP